MTPQQFSEWRSWLGLTQAQVADWLQINKRTVSIYESKGPIPQAVSLACMAITDLSERPNYASLVEAQHPKIRPPFLVMPYEVKRPSGYRGVYCVKETGEPELSAELLQWLDEQDWKIRTSVVTLELPDTRRRDVAVVVFEDEIARDAFIWRWR